MTTDAGLWLQRYAEALGAPVPTESEIESLLELAGVAAHASDRTAAPVSCWLAARERRSLAEALAIARDLASALGDEA